MVVFLSMIMFLAASMPLFAEEKVTLESFDKLVEESEYYKDSQEEMIEQDVLVEADTEKGKRYTSRYVLKSDETEEKYLIFVGDVYGTIIEAVVMSATETSLSIHSLLEKNTTSIHTRGPVYECATAKCDKWKWDFGFDPDPGCRAIVGQACNDFEMIIGKRWSKLVCKASVYLGCSVTADKVCTHYYEEWDICGL